MRHVYFSLVLCLFGFIVFSQSKEGYIQYDKVIQNITEYSNDLKNIELLNLKLEDSLKRIVQQFSNRIHVHSTGNIDLTTNELEKRKNQILKLEKQIETYRNELLNTIAAEKLKIKNKVILQLKEYCFKNNITCVIDKSALFYCSNCIDYTDSFIAFVESN
ncbi:OmpH family outer membrane protein [Aquimarina algiphila]|uniref:OmpH family outer membrane protein n=1 Tax=Aquimarina algiphila TaxID=2047982 RepID=UPI00248FB388|nr:OmpH family outer membrane protein [Aquimarina algiphila]